MEPARDRAGPAGEVPVHAEFWETPTISHDEHAYVLKGRSHFVSPAAYRINQQISIDDEDFFNFGIMWLTKNVEAPAAQP